MRLYLVQHAEAKQEKEDHARPLSERGEAQIRKVANFLARQANIRVSSIMHSEKTRSRQTAEILAEYLHPPGGIKEVEDLEPLDEPSIWINRLAQIEEGTMLVGHLPHLSRLSSYLLCQDENRKIIEFQMGGIICLKKDESGLWLLQWMVVPEILIER